MKLQLQLNKLIDSLLILIFAVFMFYIYPAFVSKYYLYMGFEYEFNKIRFFIAFPLFILLLLINSQLKDLGYFVSSLFLVLFFIPNMVMFVEYPHFQNGIFISIFLFQLFLSLAFLIKFSSTKIVFPTFNKQSNTLIIIIISLIALFPFFLTFRFNLDFKLLTFQDVYSVRAQSSKQFTTLMTYFYSWLAKIIFPVGMILALQYKQKFLFLFLFLSELYLYLVAGHKTVFIALILIIFFFIKNYQKQIRYLILGILFVAILGWFLWFFKGNINLESLFVRRVFFLPALLNHHYFEFFSNEKLFLSHSIFKSLVQYPFDLDPSHLIGKIYFNNPLTNANNGFIADGFMNFGYIGVFIYSVGVIIYFKILQHLNISHKFAGVLIIIIFTLISSAFLTSLLSHGLILFMLMSMFLLYDSGKRFET